MVILNETETKVSAVLNCIDLSNSDIHQSATLIKKACIDSGIFYVINHGISEEFMNEVFAKSKKFFALPRNEKMKLNAARNLGYKNNKITDQEINQQALGESFVTIHEADRDVDNFWPSTGVLPGWKETVQRYQREVLNVGRAVARIIAVALGINFDFFDQPDLLGNALSSTSFNHYAVEDGDPSQEYMLGAAAHTDPYLITLLATDDVPGLQICRNPDAKPRLWETVLPLKGSFIVNIGDMLERMSNCIFRSTKHRVIFRQERYTIALFVYPSLDGNIECLPSCKTEENPPKYPPIKCEEFLDKIYGDGVDDRKLITKI